jgi:hypothetical protein
VNGFSNGELTLWRRASDTTPPRALAHFTLDRDDSQLLAGHQFVGRLAGDKTALFVPDWLRNLGAGLQALGPPEAHAHEEEQPGRRLERGGRELSGDEPLRIDAYENARQLLLEIEPNNPRLDSPHSPQWVSSWKDVQNLQLEVHAALVREAEAAARNDRTTEAYRSLVRDPDHGVRVTPTSLEEREVILELERRGLVASFVVRGSARDRLS